MTRAYRLTILITPVLLTRAIYAQLPLPATPTQTPAPTKAVEEDPFGRETPHGCVLGFLKAAGREDYAEAAHYLDTQEPPFEAQELARQLAVVLNHGLSGNLDELSRAPEGALKDRLRKNRDRMGSVKLPSQTIDILLDRVQRGNNPPIWLFSSETLPRIPRAYEEINISGGEKFAERLLPGSLRAITVFSLPLWRWLAIILSMVVAIALASLVTRALIPLFRLALRRMTGQTDDRYLLSLKRPVRLLLLALAIRFVATLAMSVLARAVWTHVSHVIGVAGAAWLLMQFSNIVSSLRSRQLVRRQAANQIAVLALAHRLFKILVVFLAAVLLLQGAGVNVSAMLAGLGIGGIALALAAQKTLEDLFGGISIITRKAIRIGDFCQLAGRLGTIEDIGLGSTRVRTLDRTLVTIPNGKVSQMDLENYSMREKIWFHHVFGLPYDTSAGQVRSVLAQVAHMLQGDGRVERDTARIRLIDFGPSSLSFEMFAYFRTTDYTAFLEIQEELLLRVMDIVAANGTRIALPSQTTYLSRDKSSHANGLRSITHEDSQERLAEAASNP